MAGHEFDHGAVLPGTDRRIFSFWRTDHPAVDSTDPLLGAGHSWAPGFPRIEAAPLVVVAAVDQSVEALSDDEAALAS